MHCLFSREEARTTQETVPLGASPPGRGTLSRCRSSRQSSDDFEWTAAGEDLLSTTNETLEEFLLESVRARSERLKSGAPAVRSSRLPAARDVLAVHARMLEQYEKMRSAPARESEEGESTALASTMMAPLTHGVAPPLEGLRPITLAEAATRVNSIWAGRALFVRTVRPALRLVGVSLVVEDSQGAVLTVSLYNLVAPEEDPQTVFPVGTCLALSEPCAGPPRLPRRRGPPHGPRLSLTAAEFLSVCM